MAFKIIKKLIWLLLFITTLYAQTDLKLEFSQAKQNINTGLITVSLTNNSKQDVEILKWKTPFEKNLSANIFHITDGKNSAQYLGRVVKRLEPKENDYMTLKAGGIKSVTVNLAQYYRFESKGNFYVSYRGDLKTKEGAEKKLLDRLSQMNIPSIRITYTSETTQKKKRSSSTRTSKKVSSYNSCTQTEVAILNDAHIVAITIAQNAADAMNHASQNTAAPRYRTWFGVADNSRQSTVTTHFRNIYSALNTKNITFDCSCSDSYIAYVYPSQPYIIYLCDDFWNLNLRGTDSKSGSLIHEVSHFNVVANTEDYVYSQRKAKELAINHPNEAIFNADNHEYFTENTPYLAMEPDSDRDGVIDANDAFPNDASESVDTDGDGIGNNADKDDDNDGLTDKIEKANGLNPLDASDAQADFDHDGFSNAEEIGFGTDIHNAKSKPAFVPIYMGDGLTVIVRIKL
jgi:peptidyl-Lys metalloendopeptidase